MPRAPDTRVANARRLRRDMTDAERKLWRHLRGLELHHGHFRRQATIGPYYADFACHQLKLVIEVDGGQHNESEQKQRDAGRTAYMQANGYRVLRFWNNEVHTNIEGVMERIVALLHGPPTPTPPHRFAGGGEG